jgi:hypothetical protein
MLTDEPVTGTIDASGFNLNGGRVYCFEVNPNPGFSYFEAQTGQPIAQAVARYLMGC